MSGTSPASIAKTRSINRQDLRLRLQLQHRRSSTRLEKQTLEFLLIVLSTFARFAGLASSLIDSILQKS